MNNKQVLGKIENKMNTKKHNKLTFLMQIMRTEDLENLIHSGYIEEQRNAVHELFNVLA